MKENPDAEEVSFEEFIFEIFKCKTISEIDKYAYSHSIKSSVEGDAHDGLD
jgi:hypothetical protein